jgi:hypothetical protein
MEQLVERKYAEVGLRSDYVAEMVRDAVQEAEETVTTAVETAANAMDSAERAVDQSMSAWVALCDKHDIDVNDRKEMKLKFREGVENLSYKLMAARRVWRQANQDPIRLQTADVVIDGQRRGTVSQLSKEPLAPPD